MQHRYRTDDNCPRPTLDEARRSVGRRSLTVVGLLLVMLLAALLSAFLSTLATAATSNVYWRVDLNQGSSIIAHGQGTTEQAAWDDCFRLQVITRAMTAAETRKLAVAAVSTSVVRWCQNPKRYATVSKDLVEPPPPPPPVPGLISWTVPATNDNGTPLTKSVNGSLVPDIAWYLVHYGTTAATQVNTVRVAANTTTYQLPPGTWFCSVRAVSLTDTPGHQSNTIQVTRL